MKIVIKLKLKIKKWMVAVIGASLLNVYGVCSTHFYVSFVIRY
jgi:hypothetical protein